MKKSRDHQSQKDFSSRNQLLCQIYQKLSNPFGDIKSKTKTSGKSVEIIRDISLRSLEQTDWPSDWPALAFLLSLTMRMAKKHFHAYSAEVNPNVTI